MLRKRQKRILYIIGACIFLYLFLAIVPTVPYYPICGDYFRNLTRLKGPLRPSYQAMLEDVLTEENFYYWKFGNQIFIRYINIFDGNETFDRYDLHVNTEWRIVSLISKGYTATDEGVTPPKPLLDALRSTEEKYGPFVLDNSRDNSERFRDCTVKRAGAIWVERLEKVPENR